MLCMVTCRESKHERNKCAMYDLCGTRKDGKELNCPYPTPAVTVRIHVHSSIYFCCQSLQALGH